MHARDSQRVLVVGVYVLNARNHAAELARQFSAATDWQVDQRWAAIGDGALPAEMQGFTTLHETGFAPKFGLLNRLMSGLDLAKYSYVVVTDDDIELPGNFLDTYLALVRKYDLSLAQPARTHDSYIDHHFVAALNGVEARQTRFVEIGPLFSIASDAYEVLLPFDESAPMGWGLDFAWPVVLAERGRKLGIVDATPVRHALRKPVSLYHHGSTERRMMEFLRSRRHLSHEDAFTATAAYRPGQAMTVRGGEVKASRRLSARRPRISAVLCTYNRSELLGHALGALCGQTLDPEDFEVVVVDDGSTDDTSRVVQAFEGILPLHYSYQTNSGLAAAKNHGVALARAPVVAFLDDDDVLSSDCLEQHCVSHREFPDERYAVLGYTRLASRVARSPLMHFVTAVGQHLFSYSTLRHGDALDFSYFWGGRSSCKRALLMEFGVFDPVFRFGCEDIELGCRLARAGLKVVFNRDAISTMIRTLDFDGFCRRSYLQGRSNWVFAAKHPTRAVRVWAQVEGIREEWRRIEPQWERIVKVGRDLDKIARERGEAGIELDGLTTKLLHRAYYEAFRAHRIKGSMEGMQEDERSQAGRRLALGE